MGFLFLSTLSLRRATSFNAAQPAAQRNFYPRSPCGERPRVSGNADYAVIISIHALLAESDADNGDRAYGAVISIHALLAESDFTLLVLPG